jgi:hypothetical protein
MTAVEGALALIAALGAGLAALLVLWLHTRDAGVDPRRDGVSGYGTSPVAPVYRAQVILTGLAGLALAVSLAMGGGASAVGLVMLVAFAASRLLIAANPTDREGAPRTATGRRHIVLAAVTFVAIALAAPLLGLSDPFGGTGGLDRAVRLVSILVPLSVGATFAAGSRPSSRAVFGIAERLAYAAFLGWLLLAASALLAGAA